MIKIAYNISPSLIKKRNCLDFSTQGTTFNRNCLFRAGVGGVDSMFGRVVGSFQLNKQDIECRKM